MGRTLADRLRSHEQQKARLAEREMQLKEAARKARTRCLIQVGGLVEKAGLLELDSNALYGALLTIKTDAGDPDILSRWSALGGRTFAHEARLEDEGKEPFVITFPAPVSRPVVSALRAAGFRFNKLCQHWEGRAHFDQAEVLANTYGGAVHRIGGSEIARDPRDELTAADE